MYFKSLKYDLTNIRGIIVSICSLISAFIFLWSVLFPHTGMMTEYYYMNYCTFPYINIYQINRMDFIYLFAFFLCVLFLRDCKIWGIRKETISIFILHIIYMFVKGLHKNHDSKCYINNEIIESSYRIVFMFLNCVLFFWTSDDYHKMYKSISNVDVFQINNWDENLQERFDRYLDYVQDETILHFYRENLIGNPDHWTVFQEAESKSYLNSSIYMFYFFLVL